MITAIRLQNFQSHKDSLLELAPGVNIIVGQTDSGKSAIIRALRWVMEGRPLGEEFRSHWGGETLVEIWVDGQRLARVKTSGKNAYFIGAGAEEDTLTGFGKEVPEKVRKTLPLSDVNWRASQHDPAFLLSLNPGSVASKLNEIANLTEIDSSQRNINTYYRRAAADKTAAESELVELEDSLEQFSMLSEQCAALAEIEAKDKVAVQFENNLHALGQVIHASQDVLEQIEAAEEVLVYEDQVTVLLEKVKKSEALSAFIVSANDTLQRIESCQQEIDEAEDVTEIEAKVTILIAKSQTVRALAAQKQEMLTAITRYKECVGDCNRVKATLSALQQKFTQTMPEICPLCDQPIKEKK